MSGTDTLEIPPFSRFHFESGALASRIGGGSVGGKAMGLLRLHEFLGSSLPDGQASGITVNIPRFMVIGTDGFDAFVQRNQLRPLMASGLPDDRLANAFQNADLPSEILGDLRALVEEVTEPLAVRSSSLLEDALERPFAGIYETKMIPNNARDPDTRFLRLIEAIKFVYSSTCFAAARSYRAAVGVDDAQEKMAVVIQEIVGARHGPRFYPHLSAVCRSYSYYPVGRARPEDGFAALALGLGKTIVDGGICWSYSPAYPRTPAPFASARDLLQSTQTSFWAVLMEGVPVYDPIAETEYLGLCDLADAEYDGVLGWLASTYDAQADRLRPGIGAAGPRVLDFAPLLKLRDIAFNDALRKVVAIAEESVHGDVEIELAMLLPDDAAEPPRLAVLQARPMMAARETIDVAAAAAHGEPLLASTRAMGNGAITDVCDVVYLRADAFQIHATRRIAAELQQINHGLVAGQTPYLLIGFGRWGSSDPSLGVPVSWGQVSGARAIVEAALAGVNVEPSQGSHFFHNLSSLQVPYLTAANSEQIDWRYLEAQAVITETEFVRHVRLAAPLGIYVDGRTGRGIILHT